MIRTIPLNKLVQSPRNVRKHSDAAADAELAASIAALGLLQNLIVRPGAKGKFEVEAGERRRRAMLVLADDKVLPRDHQVSCLVLEDTVEAAVETSLAENFHRLAMNPADEAVAFASLIESGVSIEDVARRFGLTVRFVEGRLRLAMLAPVVFEALAAGEITLDIAKAYGATSDQAIQAQVFEQISSAYYAPNPDSIRSMVLSGTVRGNETCGSCCATIQCAVLSPGSASLHGNASAGLRSITPCRSLHAPPTQQPGERSEHGSLLSENFRPSRVSSQRQSRTFRQIYN